jgi:hypothetical protein
MTNTAYYMAYLYNMAIPFTNILRHIIVVILIVHTLMSLDNKFKYHVKKCLLMGSFYLGEYFDWRTRDSLGSYKYVRFEVFTAMTMKNIIWDVALCGSGLN